MSTTRFCLLFALLALTSLVLSACDGTGEEPIGFDICAEVECEQGLTCQPESGDCRCTETSCGEGRICSEDANECLEAPHRRCETGTRWHDDRCICDEEFCDGDGRACSEDDARCVFTAAEGSCVEGTSWDQDSPAFRDVSADFGLPDIGAEGVRISAADVTGNGWPDLLVRRSGFRIDDFSDEGERHFWFLANQGDGSFRDITEESGILQRRDGDSDRGRPAEVIALADVNNNGALDVVTLFSASTSDDPTEGAEILWNDGDGNFELADPSDDLHAAAAITARSGASFVDIDRDGFVDLWVGDAGGQNRLFKGDGSGQFTDITAERGLTTSNVGTDTLNEGGGHGHTWSTAACDLDKSGVANLLAGSYGRAPNHLWGAGPDQFENYSVASGYAFDHRKDWTDNESARCFCSLNRSAEDCEDVPEPAYIRCDSEADVLRWNHANDRQPYRLGGNSGTTVCGDLNNNGSLDLLTTEIVHWDVGESSDPSEILYNTGESPPRFERPGNEVTGLTRQRSGVTWDDGDITAAVFDFDNDGRLDILIGSTDYPGTRALLYHQQPDGTFSPVSLDVGIDHTSAHGIAIADFTKNGALDVAIGHSRARCGSGDHCLDESHVRLFENQIGSKNNWIQLDLEGADGTNRAAIGAQITVGTEELMQTSEVGGGHGHYGMQNELIQHFGLGSNCEATVIIRWPDQDLTEEVYRLPAGHRYHVKQGELPVIIE